MRLNRFNDPKGFQEACGPFLEAREAEHNLLLGLTDRLVIDPKTYGDDPPYMALLREGEEVRAVSLRTPPYDLILWHSRDTARLPSDGLSRMVEVLAPNGRLIVQQIATDPQGVPVPLAANWRAELAPIPLRWRANPIYLNGPGRTRRFRLGAALPHLWRYDRGHDGQKAALRPDAAHQKAAGQALPGQLGKRNARLHTGITSAITYRRVIVFFDHDSCTYPY